MDSQPGRASPAARAIYPIGWLRISMPLPTTSASTPDDVALGRACLAREVAANHFGLLPISLEHAAAVEGLPFHHRDPFDRLLVAQAQTDGIAIVSGDAALDAYGV